MTYWPGKTHLRRLHPVSDLSGEVLPVFNPRSPDFVLQLAFGLKWPHSKSGVKPLKPGGATLENVFFPCFALFSRCLCFTSISFLSCTLLASNLAGCLFGRWSTCVPREMVRQSKSCDLSVSENLISDHVFFPPVFNPPVCRLRTPASFWSELVTYQIWRDTVKTGRSKGR